MSWKTIKKKFKDVGAEIALFIIAMLVLPTFWKKQLHFSNYLIL